MVAGLPPAPAPDALAVDLAAALDRVAFARQTLAIEPDPWQARLLRSEAPRVLLNVCRQAGKSTTASLLATHQALYVPDSLVLLVSPSERQSGELFKKCLATYRASGRQIPAESETTQWLTLANGSRIVSLPGAEATVRGFSAPSLVIEDEAARTSDDLYLSVRPMLAAGGRLLLMSTPFGQRGHFHEEWTAGGPTWERYAVRGDECPRIPSSFLEEERRTLPRRWFAQEWECQFEDTVDQLFASEDIRAALSTTIKPLFASPPLLLGGAS